jgi:hypothetical protein
MRTEEYSNCAYTVHTADIGFGDMQLLPDDDGNAYYVRVLETKTKEMTLDEIEKKLGHKVKIVNK